MKLRVPKDNISGFATEELIVMSINSLKEEIDSFAILEKDEMNYIQALRTENGFIVQFQNGSLDEHYEFNTYLSRPQTINLFKSYYLKIENWQCGLAFRKIDTRDFLYKIGYAIGSFWGHLIRSVDEARNARNNNNRK